MTNSHTPGPWRPTYTGRGNARYYRITATAPAIPGFCGERPIDLALLTSIDELTNVANATLMASAPELLGALRRALSFTEANNFGGYDALELMDECRAVIAKATGDQP